MGCCQICLVLLGYVFMVSFAASRAINISNSWMLPEDNFAVFYRYFRDRISWYEADAVCQFHHANLVTADTSAQYDAIRAYLRELDISENIWIGLSKNAEKTEFRWTNSQRLTGEGHWHEVIPKTNEAICTSMDPSADYLWRPKTCGGPDIASFICELPVPSWAMGPSGCLFTELPSLTVLYTPEQTALELISECGPDEIKTILCHGNINKDDVLKQLTCHVTPDDYNSSSSTTSTEDLMGNGKTTKPWTSNTIEVEYGSATRHRRETEDTLSPLSTKTTTDYAIINIDENATFHSDVSLVYENTPENNASEIELTIQNSTEESDGDFYTTELNTSEVEIQENIEGYPSAIGQGQLFNIVGNVSMSESTETPETTVDDEKSKTDELTTQSFMEVSRTSDIDNASLYTTVVYQKEPPSEMSFVTNKSFKRSENKTKSFTKERIEDFEAGNHLKEHKIVAKKPMHPKFVFSEFALKELVLSTDSTVSFTTIGQPQASTFPKNENKTRIKAAKYVKNNFFPSKKEIPKKNYFLPKSLIGEVEKVETSTHVVEESSEPEPEVQPRPNRQRLLTRPQRRSFYPYFFSRVLG